MQQPLQDLLARRRDRAIAIVLGVKERECDRDLSAMASQKLRKVVLDQFNDFYDICVDVMGSLDNNDVVLNEFWLQKIEDIHSEIVRNGKSDAAHSIK